MNPLPAGPTTGDQSSPEAVAALEDASGLVAGTILLTADGEMPVEFITAGDRIITRDAGLVRLAGVALIRDRRHAIHFAAGSLGDTRPETDLILPAAQRVLIRDWRARALFGTAQAIVRAGALVDGEFIRHLGPRDMSLCMLRFNRPHIVYAGGLEVAVDEPRAAPT